MKKQLLALLLALTLGLTLIACAAPAPTPSAAPEAQPAPEAPAPAEGAEAPAPAASGEPIVFGSIQDVSGPISVLGIGSVRGHEMAVKHINEAGGIDGRPIKFINYDTKNDPNEAINAYKRLAEVDGAVAIMGPPVTNIALAIQSTTNELGVACVGTFADARSTMGENLDTLYPYMFILQATSDMYGELAAEHVYDNFGGKDAKIGIISAQDHAFMASYVEAFVARCQELGMEVVARETNLQADTDMKAQLINIQNSGATVLFNGNPVQPLVISTTQAYQLGLDVVTVGSNDYSIPFNTLVSDPAIANDIYFPTNVNFEDPALQGIREEYVNTYGEEPTRFSYLGYDQVMVCAEAVRQAGAADAESIKNALENITDYQLCSGMFSFEKETHLPLGLSLVFYELHDGEYINPDRYLGFD